MHSSANQPLRRLKVLDSKGYHVTINRPNVVEEIEKVRKYTANVIKPEMVGKLIRFMSDIATKSSRSVIVIYLAAIIYDILLKFDVSLDHVFAIVTENAKNVVNSTTIVPI